MDLADLRDALSRRLRSIVVLAVVAAAPQVARADDGWKVAVTAGTNVPIDVGVRVQLETPQRVRLSLSAGILPGAYVDAINVFLVGIEAYPQETADLVRSSLEQSLVVRAHAGVRPWRCRGFYAEMGYGLVGLGGGSTGAEIIEAATGEPVPSSDDGTTREFDVRSRLHLLDLELGWEWTVVRRLRLRAALGGAFTLASSTAIEPEYQPAVPRLTEQFTTASEQYLDDIFTTYVHTPVVTIAVGYAF